MVRQGWLAPCTLPQGPGYALTPKAVHRLDDAAERVYRSSDLDWDGQWHLLIARTPPVPRVRRQRVTDQLAFLGYAPISATSWLAPRAHPDVVGLLAAEEMSVDRFTATHDGPAAGPGSMAELVRLAWDLSALDEAYEQWLDDAVVLLATLPVDDEQAFAQRSQLVNGWRKFLFRDPGLPRMLLPDDWSGIEASTFFAEHSERLLPAATRHIDACLN